MSSEDSQARISLCPNCGCSTIRVTSYPYHRVECANCEREFESWDEFDTRPATLAGRIGEYLDSVQAAIDE